jgi:hypothetical protein
MTTVYGLEGCSIIGRYDLFLFYTASRPVQGSAESPSQWVSKVYSQATMPLRQQAEYSYLPIFKLNEGLVLPPPLHNSS